MPLHVLRHVEAHQLDAHDPRELARDLGLADTGRAREQERADRLFPFAQSRARHLDGRRQGLDGLVLPEHDQLDVAVQGAQHVLVGGRHGLGGDPRHLRHHVLDVANTDGLASPGRRQKLLRRARLVDHVDGLVGEEPLVDVAVRKLGGGSHRRSRVPDLVVLLESGLEAVQDLHRLLDRGLADVNLLESP